MGNLFDLKCPKCGDTDQLDVKAQVWLRLTPDGTDADASECGDHEYDKKSPLLCNACGHAGSLGQFETE